MIDHRCFLAAYTFQHADDTHIWAALDTLNACAREEEWRERVPAIPDEGCRTEDGLIVSVTIP